MDPRQNQLVPAFARLTPHNIEACKAFSNVVDTILSHPTQFEHHRKFIGYSPTQVPLHSVLEFPSSSSAVGTGTDTDTEPAVGQNAASEIAEQKVWKGSYQLCLDVPPFGPALGWRAGSGRWLKNPTGSIDLLLSYNTPQDDVRGSHALFTFKKDTGVLMVQPRHPGQSGIKLKAKYYAGQNNAQALIQPASVLQIGRLEYEFVYTIDAHSAMESRFQVRKSEYFQAQLNAPPPNEATSVTPSWNSMAIGPWTIPSTVGKGTYGVVSAAIHENGAAVAVKSFLRHNRQTDKSVMDEMMIAHNLMRDIKNQDYREYILQLQEVIFQRGASKFDGGPPEQVWMLYTPLARCPFSTYFHPQGTNPPKEVRVALLKQVLKGLICLHAHGWVHRDLKPANLGVVSIEPPKAVILDLGQAHHIEGDETQLGIQPQPGQIGTVLYIAPEMELRPYNERVDVWAFGLIALQVMTAHHPWKMSVNPWRRDMNQYYDETMVLYEGQMKDWRKAAPNTVENLALKLLERDPRRRLSAAEALKHPFFQAGLANAAASAEIESGKKRQRE